MPKSHSVALVGLVVFLAAAHGLPSLLRTDAEPSPVQQEPDIHFHFLLDRSGSMHHLKEDVLGGLKLLHRGATARRQQQQQHPRRQRLLLADPV